MRPCYILLIMLTAMCFSCGLKSTAPTAADGEKELSILTADHAAEFASEIANERCQHVFGVSPFSPDSYPATMENSRWHWGKIQPPGISGFSAEIEFNVDGSSRYVRVVYHTSQSIT